MVNINDDLIVDNYLEAYFNYINQFKTLTKEELKILFQNKDYETIYNHNLRLVPFLAKKFIKNKGTLSIMDLIQEGNIGLREAIYKYDYKLGNAFSTYTAYWISQKMSLAIARNSRIINLSYDMHFKYVKYKKALNNFLLTNGRNPNIEELAKELQMSIGEVKNIMNSEKEIYSLDEPLNYNGEEMNKSELKTQDNLEEDILNKVELQEIIKMAKINKKDLEILVGFYCQEISAKDLGDKYKCTRQNIEDSLKRNIQKLKDATKEVNKPQVNKLSEINITDFYQYLKTRSIKKLQDFFKNFSYELISTLFTYAQLSHEEWQVLDKLLGINSLVVYSIDEIAIMFNYDREKIQDLIKQSCQKLMSLIKVLYPQYAQKRIKKIQL